MPFSKPREGPFVSAAPEDMFCARGGRGQRLYVVPSLDLVVTRLGDRPPIQDRYGVTGFDEEFWSRLATALPHTKRELDH